jgi:hypothetical protein
MGDYTQEWDDDHDFIPLDADDMFRAPKNMPDESYQPTVIDLDQFLN